MERIYLSGEVGWDITLATVRSQIKGNGDLYVHINSYGGDVTEGWAIYDELRAIAKVRKITTVNDGVCASMGSVLMLAGDERLMRPNSKLMIHNPWGTAQGDAKEIERYVSFIKSEEEKMSRFYAKKTGVLLEKVVSMMDSETWMNAEEAISLGFATGTDQLKAVAKFNKPEKEVKDNFTKEQQTWLEKKFEALGSMFKKNGIKAMVTLTVVTEDGDLPIYVDSEDGELAGKTAYTDEAMTAFAPEGSHSLEDGRVLVVGDSGVVESVSEADAEEDDSEEMKALKEEIEALKNEKEEMKAQIEEKTNALLDANASVLEIKAMIEGSDTKPKVKGDGHKATPNTHEQAGHPIELAFKSDK